MPSALSADLRERVVTAIEAGASRREAARRFEVSPASAVRWHESFVQEGRTQAKPMGGDQRSHAVEVWLRRGARLVAWAGVEWGGSRLDADYQTLVRRELRLQSGKGLWPS